ncbi:hypothetical protein GPECTOR_15g402 [Gonium pectorale]|uniref:Uncharacterized protein n=1 Tax=Gonium pectorale TaxID=33097 RepID=A0A150GLR0_GONPE|nr:hypothetical protein GPECTOR_15g402 [Gonium pectorale]|eukprot:KXZ50718.1 hypothetical protein GPECTOR_15g402 [Gonium pectorale]
MGEPQPSGGTPPAWHSSNPPAPPPQTPSPAEAVPVGQASGSALRNDCWSGDLRDANGAICPLTGAPLTPKRWPRSAGGAEGADVGGCCGGEGAHNPQSPSLRAALQAALQRMRELAAENQRLRAKLSERDSQLATRQESMRALSTQVADLSEERNLYRSQLSQLCVALLPSGGSDGGGSGGSAEGPCDEPPSPLPASQESPARQSWEPKGHEGPRGAEEVSLRSAVVLGPPTPPVIPRPYGGGREGCAAGNSGSGPQIDVPGAATTVPQSFLTCLFPQPLTRLLETAGGGGASSPIQSGGRTPSTPRVISVRGASSGGAATPGSPSPGVAPSALLSSLSASTPFLPFSFAALGRAAARKSYDLLSAAVGGGSSGGVDGATSAAASADSVPQLWIPQDADPSRPAGGRRSARLRFENGES